MTRLTRPRVTSRMMAHFDTQQQESFVGAINTERIAVDRPEQEKMLKSVSASASSSPLRRYNPSTLAASSLLLLGAVSYFMLAHLLACLSLNRLNNNLPTDRHV
ncbi:hypothetical protein ABZP36_021670 [Zizania latifolia]